MNRKILRLMKNFKTAALFFLLFLTSLLHAQLSDFNLNVTKTDETCLGNGSLTFSVSNTTQNSSILYKVYHLPNTTNAIAILTGTYVGALSSGNYKVVAIQSLGSQQNTKEKTITINNLIVPFTFSVTSANQNCAAGATLTLTSSSGNIAQCEIIAGPVLRPLQTSNVFNDLPAGTYNIRAFNDCGNGKVKTFSLSLINSVLNISDPAYPDAISPLCDSITVTNTITPSLGTISYPISVQHTLTPMDINGNSIVISQVFETGSPDAQVVSAVLPRYISQTYTYDITVTDNCSTVYEKLDNVVDPTLLLKLSVGEAPCAEKFLKINAAKFTTSYTVSFLSAPSGFNPADYNATPQGPFTSNAITFGSADNSVPFGTYEVQITDICGRTVTESILIEFIKPTPSGSGYNNGCFSEFGGFSISVPPQHIVSATLTAAPATYTGTVPATVTSNINAQGKLNFANLPLGFYTLTFTDDCGFSYEKKVEVPAYVEKDFNIAALPSCEPGIGTVRYRSGNGDLTAVTITGAPAAFNYTLPYDVTAALNADGDFYMDNMPQGTYYFTGTDICGIVNQKAINVEGYIPPVNSFTYTPNCGGFSVKVTDASNGLEGATYWLQKYYPATNSWSHPNGIGSVYTEGTEPATANAIKLSNNATRPNLNYAGTFRIIKKFESFGNGTAQNTICVSILGTFDYTDGLAINTAYSLACLGTPNDVMLEVTGQPTSFKIIEKNGSPFTLNNGTNKVFKNLEPAEYVFSVEDNCGNVVTKWFNVNTLPSISDATQPNDMVQCVEPGTVTNNEFHLTDQNAAILGPLYSAMYTITYHLTSEDADAGINPLPELYTNTTNGQTIYVRLINNEIALCHGTTSFKLFIGEYQEPKITTSGTICDNGRLALNAGAGYNSYLWSTGETTRSINVTEPGVYTVIVQKAYGTGSCDGFAEVEVIESFTPNVTKVEVKDWTADENMIVVHTDGGPGTFLYSIDGVNYQEDNSFTGLVPGEYTVYVKDINGCGQVTKDIVLLNYPKFFTPNGDGSHDKWFIKYSAKEPNLRVAVLDRYGKLITNFGSTSDGWDGTLNGIQLPSTDYWFVVTREDGRELKGHFAMVR